MYSEQTLEQMRFSGLGRKDENNKYEYSWFIAATPERAQTLSNDLAKKDWELLIMGVNLSVLNRTNSSPRNVKYYKFDDYKKLKKRFTPLLSNATLVETGMDFTVLYCDFYESKWFFTVPLKNEQNALQKETIFLNMYEIYSAYRTKNAVPAKVELTREQLKEIEKEVTERINQLLKENYEVKNFNYLSGFTVMLKRSRK